MKAASSTEIKKELKGLTQVQLIEICLRLARFKKENKELLTYLLFEAEDLDRYIQEVKVEMEEGFAGINSSHIYFAKKSLRKILRITNKHIRYTGSKTAEAELLIHFCYLLQNSGIKFKKHTALLNLYQSQVKKARAAIETMHEDLQYEYLRRLELVESF